MGRRWRRQHATGRPQLTCSAALSVRCAQSTRASCGSSRSPTASSVFHGALLPRPAHDAQDVQHPAPQSGRPVVCHGLPAGQAETEAVPENAPAPRTASLLWPRSRAFFGCGDRPSIFIHISTLHSTPHSHNAENRPRGSEAGVAACLPTNTAARVAAPSWRQHRAPTERLGAAPAARRRPP